jgi:hypothetical protein
MKIVANAIFDIFFVASDFTKCEKVWEDGVLNSTELSSELTLFELNVYGNVSDNKFKVAGTSMLKIADQEISYQHVEYRSKSSLLLAISTFFGIGDDHADKKLAACIEALIFQKSNIFVPDLRSLSNDFDIILERGHDISIEKYRIPAEKVRFFVNRQIKVSANPQHITATKEGGLEDNVLDEFEYLENYEATILGCEEGVL